MRAPAMRVACGASLLLPLVLAACALVSHYDATSYKNATDLKAEALVLMDKAKDPPATHAAAIDSLTLKLRQAYEYERGKGNPNRFTVKQWELLLDPNAALLGGFIHKWRQANAAQGDALIEGVKKNVAQGFDEIIKLERAKVKE